MPNILPFNMHSDSSSDSRLDDAGNFECQCDVVFTYLMVDWEIINGVFGTDLLKNLEAFSF